MILVDTSVVISFLRKGSPSVRAIFRSRDCAICGITRAEILHGSRSAQDAEQLTEALDRFIQLPIAESIWDALGHNLATLRAAGLPLQFQDVLLATISIRQQAELWSHDKHFLLMQPHLPGLLLFPESAE